MEARKSESKSSAALRSATGRDYAEWFQALDEWGAPGRPYQQLASWLTGEHGVSGWWAQKLIVEYEQDRGLRQPGARPDGTFAGGASRTIAAPVERVFEAFTDGAFRARWLPALELTMRRAQPRRSVRFDVADGTKVNVTFAAKGDRCQVAVEHDHLPDADSAQQAKAAWGDRLSTLKTLIES